MSKQQKIDNDLQTLVHITLVFLILLLSMFNLQQSKKNIVSVLGTKTDNVFWEKLAEKHPTYRDAWVELKRSDKVEEIDPNYK